MVAVMYILVLMISATCPLITSASSATTEQCTSVISNRCLQNCKATSCKCTQSDSNYAFTKCNQVCEGSSCKKLVCSSRTCVQRCHGCRMECTNDVEDCSQLCLSGECTFKCSAKQCFQKCDGKKCDHLPLEKDEPSIPRLYLAILAALFALMTILTCLALVISCSHLSCWRRRRQPVLVLNRNLENSIRNLPMRSEFVWKRGQKKDDNEPPNWPDCLGILCSQLAVVMKIRVHYFSIQPTLDCGFQLTLENDMTLRIRLYKSHKWIVSISLFWKRKFSKIPRYLRKTTFLLRKIVHFHRQWQHLFKNNYKVDGIISSFKVCLRGDINKVAAFKVWFYFIWNA